MSDTTGHQFSTDELRTLAAVLDEIIPPSADRKLPGAGIVASGAHFERIVRLMPGLDLGLAGGLAALDASARERGVASYVDLPAADRLAVLNEVAASDGGFVPSLMFVSYVTYYVEGPVVTALELEPRPPHPQGFVMPANDLSLLDPVRKRGKLYRDA